MKNLSLKVPVALDRKLAAVVRRRGVRKSALVREALSRYLAGFGISQARPADNPSDFTLCLNARRGSRTL